MSSLSQRPLRRALAGLGAAALATFALLAVSPAASASAETPGVTATCASLTVKPNGYAAKGEVRVVIDGEVQTDGDEDGWTEFKGSFPGLYTFEPDVAHTYTVEINSYAADSTGDGFTPGVGGDAIFRGPTTPCTAVGIVAAPSNCLAEKAAQKQAVDLEFTGLRRSVTYLAEVIDADGATVKHFQFRTWPVVEHRFSGLSAGAEYAVRLTDQSNPVLSNETTVSIPGCATVPDVEVQVSQCTPGSRTARVLAALSDVPAQRVYAVELQGPSFRSVRSVSAAEGAATTTFEDVPRGAHLTLTVSDEAAPVTVTMPVDVPTCAPGSSSAPVPTHGGASGSSGANGSRPSPAPSAGSTPSQGSAPTAPTAGGAGSQSQAPRPTASSSAPAAVPAPRSTTSTTSASPRAGSSDTAATQGTTGAQAVADGGPGASGQAGSDGGTAPGGNGLVAATAAVAPAHAVPTSTFLGVMLALCAILAAAGMMIRTRRRRT